MSQIDLLFVKTGAKINETVYRDKKQTPKKTVKKPTKSAKKGK